MNDPIHHRLTEKIFGQTAEKIRIATVKSRAAVAHMVAASAHVVPALPHIDATVAHMVPATGSNRSVYLLTRRGAPPSSLLFFTNLQSCSNLLSLNHPNITLSVYISQVFGYLVLVSALFGDVEHNFQRED